MSDASAGSPAGSSTQAPDEAAIRAAVGAEFNAKLKELTGADSFEALKANQDLARQEALKAQGKFEEAAKAAEARTADLQRRFEATAIGHALETAAHAGGAVDGDTVADLLRHRAKVADDGTVTIDGKPPAQAVADLLKAKPFLAKASGSEGSGTPASAGKAGATLTRSAFEALPHAERAKFVAGGGRLSD